MPISAYFKGSGDKVLASMRKEYGKDAERVFYATAQKQGQKPAEDTRKKQPLGKRYTDR